MVKHNALHSIVAFFCFFCCVTTVLAQQKSALSIVINKHSYPYHFENKNGEPDGLMVDVWKLWAKRNGHNVHFKAVSWQETLALVKQGKVDIHAGLSQTKEREAFLSFTEPFFKHGSYIFVHRELEAINSVDDLLPYTIGIPIDSAHEEQLPASLPKASVRYFDGRHRVYEAALKGEIVAFAGLERISQNYSRQDELNTLFPPYRRLNYFDGRYVAGVKKGNFALVELINDGMSKISASERAAIERKWLGIDKKRDAVTLVFTPDFHPYLDMTLEGKAEGLIVDLWRLWSEQTGRDVQFVARDLKESIQLVRDREADIHIAYPDLNIDSHLFSTSEQKYQVALQFFVANDIAKYVKTIKDLAQYEVGTFATAEKKFNFSKQFPFLKLRVFPRYQDVMLAAERGQIKVIVGEFETINSSMVRTNFQSSFVTFPEFRFGVDLHTLMIKGNDTLLRMVDEGFDKIPKEKLIAAEQKWLARPSNGYFSRSINLVNLTKEERNWLSENGPIKVGIHKAFAPVEFYDETEQKLAGINVDYLNLISERSGAKFRFIPFENWHSQYNALISGDVDLLASVTKTQKRENQLLFTASYWQMPWVVIHRSQTNKQLDIESFYGQTLAVVKGYHLVQEIRDKYPKINLKLVESLEEGIVAVERGLAAGVIENIATASEVIKSERLIDLSISVLNELPMDENRFAVGIKNRPLQSILNKSLLTINENDSQKIYEKWFSINLKTGFDKSVVLKVAAQFSVIIIIIIVFIVAWNRRLYSEVNRRKALEMKMKHMATHDELTGLPNRILLKDRLATAINLHRRQKLKLAVMFIDLDGFKLVNDTYGHDAGDELLVKVSKQLIKCVRESDTVVRFGGDEFIVVINSLHESDEATLVAEKIIAKLKRPVSLSTCVANISCSIGVALFPDDADNQSDLLKVADTLMYEIKQSSKNNYKLSKTAK